jgi:hypothetical protein
LLRLGSEATRRDIEVDFEKHWSRKLKSGDLIEMAHGVPRWKRMIQRCRKAMIQENYLLEAKSGKWLISEQGRQVAVKEK